MLSNTGLLELYRAEKAAMTDSIFTEFPTFAEWKKKYMEEYEESHSGSSFIPVESAIEFTDAEIDGLPAMHSA